MGKYLKKLKNSQKEVKIGILGKYVGLQDAYKSLKEALIHAGLAHHAKIDVEWIDAEDMEEKGYQHRLESLDGIVVAGGFGKRGTQGMMNTLEYARKNNLPCFGICYGMQMAILEFARNILNIQDANSSEWGEGGTHLVGLLTQWVNKGVVEQRSSQDDMGGTMRLGSYECHLKEGSLVAKAYQKSIIHERHRHRYEVNIDYRKSFEDAGLIFSGVSPDGTLPEIIELKDHPWFVGVQFHPELKSRPFDPHPLFVSLVEASLKKAS